MYATYLKKIIPVAALLLFAGISILALSCSDDSNPAGSGTYTYATPVDIAPPISGLGQPAPQDVEVKFISVNTVSVTVVDTIPVAQYDPLQWDGVSDTLGVATQDTQLVVWRTEQRQFDTTLTLTETSNGTFSVVLPEGSYTIAPSVEGTLDEFYDATDTTVVSDGITPITYRPAFTIEPFGAISGRVLSCATATSLDDTVRIVLTEETLLDPAMTFYTDASGNFSIAYLPAGEIELIFRPMGVSSDLFAVADTVVMLADGQHLVLNMCLDSLGL
ncbi:MAG: hypothetical protein GF331_03610 [Chitinivibrionales bacterium]|nr:hypothetical protein [Chitinivibrionales bacterium]